MPETKGAKKIGLIVNPLAGIGGRVGLKGSDGRDIVEKAFAMGAVAEAPMKAAKALERLVSKKEQFQLLTYPGLMGEKTARELGYEPVVLGCLKGDATPPEDTEKAAADM